MKARGKLLSAEGCRNIYISEDLTKRRQSLFQGARQLLKEKKITKVWTWDGKVFLTDINLQKHKIDCHNDLSKFTCASPLYSDILQSSVSAQGAHGPHRLFLYNKSVLVVTKAKAALSFYRYYPSGIT
ncbi:hypothetical protein KUTeg_014888 [Tegillarca granosa]|uniref:Uncharacterized protein n=1 Tax=Tegillarca granosa TaxID=220873 RepID=A0ABQ9ENL9_TEGGR|nr:hypothetical protein KUTeg_014888 [Tegillarca granosa]